MLIQISVTLCLLSTVALAAPPAARPDKDAVNEADPEKNVEIARPVHLDGVALERDGDLNKDFRQEMILGAEHTGNPEQLRDQIKAMFQESDLDADGELSSDELFNRISNNTQAHMRESEQEAADKMTQVDWNGDRKITWEEYLPHFLKEKKIEHDQENNLPLGEDGISLVEQEHTSFTSADEDQSSDLEASEWLGFLHPEHSRSSLIQMAKDIIKSFDKNSDSQVSREEFVSFAPGEVEEQFAKMEADERKHRESEFDDDIDVDKDGFASLDEFVDYVNPKNVQHAKQEVHEIMQLADVDQNGKLSLDELLERDWLLQSSALISANRRLHDDL